MAVLRPGSIDDIARMLRFAWRHDIRVVGRGAGHTTLDQSQHAAGIAFDMTTLDAIGPVVGDRITVGAGCCWNQVLPATLDAQLMPPVPPTSSVMPSGARSRSAASVRCPSTREPRSTT